MNTNKFLTLFLSSLLLLCFRPLHGCSYYPSAEYTRFGSFFQYPNGMEPYKPFIYTFDLYYSTDSDPLLSDRGKILEEWQIETGESVSIKDIEIILYQTSPNMFLHASYYNKLNYLFEGNSFIEFLTQSPNINYLRYIEIMKQMEYAEFYLNDPWLARDQWEWDETTGMQNNLFSFFCNQFTINCEKLLKENNNDFLNARLNFQLAKMYLKTRRFNDCEKVIEQYFNSHKTGFLHNAMFHYLGACYLAEGDTAQANLNFARSFKLGNERKFRNMQLFRTSKEWTDKAISLTDDKSEKALLVGISAMRNPGHALHQLKMIEQFDPTIPEFLFLIYREVNKFDDWIASSDYANLSPSVSIGHWDSNDNFINDNNLESDKKYLTEFLSWVKQSKAKFKDVPRQYLDLAYIHLCLLSGDLNSAFTCHNNMDIKQTAAYYNQYIAEKIYIKIMSPDFSENANLNTICQLMKSLEDGAQQNLLQAKMLSTLNQILAYRMNQTNRKSYVGLIRLKSDAYAAMNEDSYFSFDKSMNYNLISWYDENNSTEEIDTLIELTLNKNKLFFQTFFTDSIIGSTDLYRDLKGTIAFRNGNLKLANSVFHQMNPNYWDNEYYKNCFGEDPFIPKNWSQKRNMSYRFSKAEFTDQMLSLMQQTKSKDQEKAVEAWLKLGHGYYNTTYWGNAWMMSVYSRSTYIPEYTENVPMPEYLKVYFNCDYARNCYLNALKLSNNIEHKALVSFMLHACDMNKTIAEYQMMNYEKRPEVLKYQTQWLKNFKQFKKTTIFQEYLSNCSYLNEYMKKGYLVL